jgi:hypothetical protein
MNPCFKDALHLNGATAAQPAVDALDDIHLGPNPALAYITLHVGAQAHIERVEWFDLNGRLLSQVPATGMHEMKLLLGDLPRGMLILKAWNRQGQCRVLRVQHLQISKEQGAAAILRTAKPQAKQKLMPIKKVTPSTI